MEMFATAADSVINKKQHHNILRFRIEHDFDFLHLRISLKSVYMFYCTTTSLKV